jgi:uncharacterized protein YukE
MADWTPLAEGDPIPGNPEGLGSLLGLLANDAAELQAVVAELKKLDAEEIWSGENADRFKAARGDVAPRLDRLAEGMKQASDALRKCAPGMGNAQGLARTAVTRAREATGNLTKADAGLDELARLEAVANAPTISAPGSPPPPPPPAVWAPNWTGLRDEAQEELDAARRLFNNARDDYDGAIDKCVSELKKIIADIEKAERTTTERVVDKAGEISLGILGQGTGGTLLGLGRSFVEKGFGRVALMEGHWKKQDAGALLPYRWMKHDFLEVRSFSKSTQLLKSIDEGMKPYAKAIGRVSLATTAWGVFGKQHDRRDLNEAEAVVATAWTVGTVEGGKWIGGKVGAHAGAWAGAQLGLAVAPFLGPLGPGAPVAGAIIGGFVGAWQGGDLGGKAGKLVKGAGEGLLKVGSGAAKTAGKVLGKLTPW